MSAPRCCDACGTPGCAPYQALTRHLWLCTVCVVLVWFERHAASVLKVKS